VKKHTAGTLVPQHRPFKVVTGIDQLLAELIQAVHETLHSEIHKFIPFGIRKNCTGCGRSLLLRPFTRQTITLAVVIIIVTDLEIVSNILLRLSPYVDEIIWISSVCL
jgi:hypothetical protein